MRLRILVLGALAVGGVGIARLWGGERAIFPLQGLQLRVGRLLEPSTGLLSEGHLTGSRQDRPILRASVSEVDLGASRCGGSREASILLTNEGTVPVKISEIRTRGVFSLAQYPLLPARIGPGVRVRVTVAYDPAQGVTDELRVVSDAPEGILTIPLRGCDRGASWAFEGRAPKPSRVGSVAADLSGDSRTKSRLLKRPRDSRVKPSEVMAHARILRRVELTNSPESLSEVVLPAPVTNMRELPTVHSTAEMTSFLVQMLSLHPLPEGETP